MAWEEYKTLEERNRDFFRRKMDADRSNAAFWAATEYVTQNCCSELIGWDWSKQIELLLGRREQEFEQACDEFNVTKECEREVLRVLFYHFFEFAEERLNTYERIFLTAQRLKETKWSVGHPVEDWLEQHLEETDGTEQDATEVQTEDEAPVPKVPDPRIETFEKMLYWQQEQYKEGLTNTSLEAAKEFLRDDLWPGTPKTPPEESQRKAYEKWLADNDKHPPRTSKRGGRRKAK